LDDVLLTPIANGFRDQNLPPTGGRLCAGGGIHHSSDRGKVPMRPAEFTETDIATADTDADAEASFS
jgi:hypothetical protein